MASKTGYELHHNFPKIADEAGFSFKVHRHRIRIDWNKIRHIDIDNLIRERKCILVEQHLNDILDCILESEFDVRILDEGVLKIFRLAQLAIEYQQFCRHYLDRSVYVLREEINSIAQDLEATKKELKDRDEEIRRLKRKTKHTYRTPLPYGNDNIASMILKTLTTGKSDFFSASMTGDSLQYNKCRFCEKVFMNQLYLKSHISRRHSHIMEVPEKDINDSSPQANNTGNNRLNDEVLELKLKLKEMENVMKNVNKHESSEVVTQNVLINTEETNTKQMKDAEVWTNEETNVLRKIEEWKRVEEEKHKKEIDMLRLQIIETINSLKENETPTAQVINSNEARQIIEQLNTTISKQGSEILLLKQQLDESRIKIEKEEADRRKESTVQMLEWANRAEIQTKQYESMVQKLNDVAKEAKESRAQAAAERQRVAQLEDLLQESLNERLSHETSIHNCDSSNNANVNKEQVTKDTQIKKKTRLQTPIEANRQILVKLHQKAQALLELESSNTSSLESSCDDNNISKFRNDHFEKANKVKGNEDIKKSTVSMKKGKDTVPHVVLHKANINGKVTKYNKKEKTSPPKNMKNGPIVNHINHSSPVKVLRAKIMEEVNDRLVSAGVDPLHMRIPKQSFQAQRHQLQQRINTKSKKNPSYEKVRHSIVAYLDTKLPQKVNVPQEYVSPNKVPKPFNLTSVISNMKSKALSLVKPIEDNQFKRKRKTLNADVSKGAMLLLNTPPDSTQSSPKIEKNNIEEKKSKNGFFVEQNVTQNKTLDAISQKSNDRGRKAENERLRKPTYSETDSEDDESKHKYYTAVIHETTKSINKLIKSPARRPVSANSDYNVLRKIATDEDNILRSQSATILSTAPDMTKKPNLSYNKDSISTSSDPSENVVDEDIKPQDTNTSNGKQTKGVLKNASSTSSLNKKKVIFDMDAIQMKSVSASPSQSITEKSDGNEKYELGLINLDGEEWDISSIENEPLQNNTKLRLSTRTSPKITELKQTIESQLARRNETPSTAIVGGIDILRGPTLRPSSMGGSNTSLGSSILDDSESPPVVSHKAFVKPKVIANKDESEIDISEFSDGIAVNKNDTF